MGIGPPQDLVFIDWRQFPRAGLSTPVGQKAGQGRARGKAAQAQSQRAVEALPLFATRAGNGTRVSMRPGARPGAMLVSPGQDLFHSDGRGGTRVARAAFRGE